MEVIRFQCPACKVPLTVPPAAAGFQGPCPKCAVEIIGPDPALGLEARLPTSAPLDPLPDATDSANDFPESTSADSTELIPPTDPFAGIAPAPTPEPTPLQTNLPQPGELADALPDFRSGSDERVGKTPEPPSKPFTDFEPPEPPPARSPSPEILTRPSRGPSVAVLVLSCLLSGVTAFVVGFVLGQQSLQVQGPVFTTLPRASESIRSEPIDVPVRTYIPEIPEATEPTKEAPPTSVGPEATLKAFLEADGWASRSAYVMFPEAMRSKMEARAQRVGDGPIQTTEVSLFEVTSEAHIFMVATPELPGSFPVAVTRQDNGWLIDWETFVEFHDDQFQNFATGKGGERGTFRLLVKPEPGAQGDSLFESFALTPPVPGREGRAFVAKNSTARARLQGVFTNKAGFSSGTYDKLMSEQGIPLVIALSHRKNSSDQAYLQIEDVISVGWGPVEP